MRTKEETQALMKEITEQINKMSNKEYLEKTEEALTYCREHKLMTREEMANPDWQKVAYKAIMRMELDKSSEWPMEKIQASMRKIERQINMMSDKEYQEKTKEALVYCKEHNLITQKLWDSLDQQDLEYKAVLRMEMDKLRHSSPEQGQESSKPQG